MTLGRRDEQAVRTNLHLCWPSAGVLAPTSAYVDPRPPSVQLVLVKVNND
jgi:hypothetical protein